MPFKDTVTAEELNALPETDRVLYIKKAGENGAADSFTLHPSFVAERTALANNNATLKTEKQKAAEQLEAFKALGLTAEQIAELKTKAEEAAASQLTEAEKKAKAEKALKDAHQAETDRLKNEAKAREEFLTRELRRNMIDAQARIAIEKAGVVEGGAEALLPHIVGAMDMLEEGEGDDRKIVTRVIGPDKGPRYVGSNFMSAEELVAEYKQKPGFGGLFKATGTGGSGSTAQNKGGSGATGVQMKRGAYDQLSPVAQREHIMGGGTVVD